MTDWENRYRDGDMPWEKGRAAPPLIELLDKLGVEIWGAGPVLVPGCGFGHDVRALVAAGLDATGVDFAQMAIAKARERSPAGTGSYEVGDFLDPRWPAGRKFAAIWEHTCFCAIDPPRRPDYAAAAAACLEEGGLLAGVFFINPHDPGEESEGPPFGATIGEIERTFSRFFTRIDGWVPSHAYPGREGREWLGLFRKSPVPGVAGASGCP